MYVLVEDVCIIVGNEREDPSGDWESFLILSDSKMEVSHAQEKVSSMGGKDQDLSKTVASVFLLPGFEKRVPKISPSIGILWVSLKDKSKCGNGLLDVLLFSFCQLIPPAMHQRRVAAEKELAEDMVHFFIVGPQVLKESSGQTIDR
jgi:hypothetical protein